MLRHPEFFSGLPAAVHRQDHRPGPRHGIQHDQVLGRVFQRHAHHVAGLHAHLQQ